MKLLVIDVFLAFVNGLLIGDKIARARKLSRKIKKY